MDRRHLVLAIAVVLSVLAKVSEADDQGEPGLELTVQEIEP